MSASHSLLDKGSELLAALVDAIKIQESQMKCDIVKLSDNALILFQGKIDFFVLHVIIQSY